MCRSIGYVQSLGWMRIETGLNSFFVVPPLPSSLMSPLPASRIEGKMYKGQSGMWSWLLHRVTGLGILLFLFIHIVDISLLGFGPQVYNDGILLFDSVIVRLLSLALIGAVLLNATNGIRIMLIDFWSKGVRYQQVMFIIVLAITIIAFI